MFNDNVNVATVSRNTVESIIAELRKIRSEAREKQVLFGKQEEAGFIALMEFIDMFQSLALSEAMICLKAWEKYIVLNRFIHQYLQRRIMSKFL